MRNILIVTGVILLIFSYAIAQNKTVVIPLMGDKAGPTCNGTLSPGGRWCDKGDGTVMDMTTGLVWLKKADWGGLKPWRNSSADCSSPNYTCYDDAHTRVGLLYHGASDADLSDGSSVGDWRLPKRKELINLVQGTEAVRSSAMQFFNNVQNNWYWTSSSAEIISYAQSVNMENAYVGIGSKAGTRYVWPVRDGN